MENFEHSIYSKISSGIFDETILETCNLTEKLSVSIESNVYLFQNETSNEKYTVKHIVNYKKYFSSETLEAIKSIDSKNITKVISCIEDEDDIFIVKEYVEGKVLNDIFIQNNIVLDSDIIYIMLNIIEILEYLHKEVGMIHRDIKPANLILKSSGEIILIDLLSVRSYKEESNKDTLYIGTAAYAAPEQFGHSQTDIRTDIYNFGATMKTLMGRRMASSSRIDSIVSKCIEFNPENRYQSIDTLKKDVIKMTLNTPMDKIQKKFKYICFTVVCILLVAAAGLGYTLNQRGEVSNKAMRPLESIYYKGVEIKASDWVHIIGGQYDPVYNETEKILGKNRRVNASGVSHMDNMEWIEKTVDVFVYSSYNAYNDLPRAFQELIDIDRYNNLKEGESIQVNYYFDSLKEVKILIVNPSLN